MSGNSFDLASLSATSRSPSIDAAGLHWFGMGAAMKNLGARGGVLTNFQLECLNGLPGLLVG